LKAHGNENDSFKLFLLEIQVSKNCMQSGKVLSPIVAFILLDDEL
jgi:hypothetical protein